MVCSKIKLYAVGLLTVTNLFVSAQPFRASLLPVEVNCSIRGLVVVDSNVAWVSGTNGIVGVTTDGGRTWTFNSVAGHEQQDFRTLFAFNDHEAIVANAGSPAYILLTDNGGISWETVYENNDPLCFIDGTDFWNNRNGIIYGDPFDGHMFILTTHDGGKTWNELPAECRPAVSEGEASFAASGTGIRCYGRKRIAMVTGGSVSRLHLSENRGLTWRSVPLPVIQGEPARGAFSIAFNDKKRAIVVGGDYTNDTLRLDNAFYTSDTGNTWSAPMQTTGGFRECVIYTDNHTAITIGPGGSDFTTDGGMTWHQLSSEKGLHVVAKARKGHLVLAAGNGKIVKMD